MCPIVSLPSINIHNSKTINIEQVGNSNRMIQRKVQVFCYYFVSVIRISYLAHCRSSTPEQLESLAQAANASARLDFSSYTCPPQSLKSVLTNDVGQGSKIELLITRYLSKHTF